MFFLFSINILLYFSIFLTTLGNNKNKICSKSLATCSAQSFDASQSTIRWHPLQSQPFFSLNNFLHLSISCSAKVWTAVSNDDDRMRPPEIQRRCSPPVGGSGDVRTLCWTKKPSQEVTKTKEITLHLFLPLRASEDCFSTCNYKLCQYLTHTLRGCLRGVAGEPRGYTLP